jgi:hypothetical protein
MGTTTYDIPVRGRNVADHVERFDGFAGETEPAGDAG